MLYEAAFWRQTGQRPPLEEGLARPDLAGLLSGWGRPGDAAVVAESAEGRPLGDVTTLADAAVVDTIRESSGKAEE